MVQMMIQKFCDDAAVDGWKIIRKRDGSSILNHSSGFRVLVYSSPIARVPLIVVWGPDNLNIYYPSSVYDFELMKKNMKCCIRCKKYVDEVFKLYVAGRVCKKCYKKIEKGKE